MFYHFLYTISYDYDFGVHRAFAVKIVFKTVKSIIATQRAFHAPFILRQNDPVPNRKSILNIFYAEYCYI